MRDLIHATEYEVIYTHAYVHADIPNTNTRACLARIPTFIPVYNTIVYTIHMHALLIRAGYVLHSPECLECGVVGKCCSNVLRSLRAYGVARKAVRTCVCVRRTIQRTCIAHDARSHTHNRVRGHIHPCIRACRHTKYEHTCMSCTYTQRNSTYHAQARPTTTHSYEQAMYCTHLSVWRVELWASAAAMCCAPSAPMEL
jgi:hypothetical protein